jgi:DNA ligase-1
MLSVRDLMQSIIYSYVMKRVPARHVMSIKGAVDYMRQIQAMGGEGLILRHPELAYTPGRTDKLLKLKTEI